MIDTVTIYEDWDERPDGIYYKWRLEGEKTWRERKTGMKTKPYYKLHYLTDEEYQLKFGVLAQATDTATPSPLESENSASQSASTTGDTQSTGELDELCEIVGLDPKNLTPPEKRRIKALISRESYRLASEERRDANIDLLTDLERTIKRLEAQYGMSETTSAIMHNVTGRLQLLIQEDA